MGCAAKVYMTGDAVRYQWYDIWSAAIAVMFMCVARGKNGKAILDGMCSKRLFFAETLLTWCSGRLGNQGALGKAWGSSASSDGQQHRHVVSTIISAKCFSFADSTVLICVRCESTLRASVPLPSYLVCL